MSSIAKLRRQSTSMTEKLKEQLSKPGQRSDENLWKLTFDIKKGIAKARIRFLPPKDGEENPVVLVMDHGIKGPNGKWYIEKSLRSLGLADPVYELNGRLYNSGVEEDKKKVINGQNGTKVRKNFYANVYVEKDFTNPENDGKVMKYRFGPTIYKYIEKALDPKDPDEQAFNPFDFWTGASLNLKAVYDEKKGQWEYDETRWDEPSEFFDGDEDKLQGIWNQCFPLQSYLDPATFKSYAQLAKQLKEVLGDHIGSGVEVITEDADSPKPARTAVTAEEAPKKKPEKKAEPAAPEVKTEKKTVVEDVEPPFATDDDSDLDEDMKLFQKFAQ